MLCVEFDGMCPTGADIERLQELLKDIRSGKFVSEWMRECRDGQPMFKAIRRNHDAHQIEEVGEKLRAMMPWIAANQLVDKAKN